MNEDTNLQTGTETAITYDTLLAAFKNRRFKEWFYYFQHGHPFLLKEEADIIAEHGFEPKDVMGKVQQKAKMYFNEVLKLAVS